MVAQPSAVRASARASRARGTASRLGRRQAQLHVVVPRAAPLPSDARAPGRSRPGPPGGTPRANPRARRGRAALCRSRPCACCSTAGCSPRRAACTAHRSGRDARGPGDAAGADRGAPRRLGAEERRLVQDGAVLGKTFTRQGAMALTGLGEDELDPLLAALVRKEVLSIQADPRSPERGMYSFLQDIVKQVAYETVSRKERKAKHLAAARLPGIDVRPRRGRGRRGRRLALSRRLQRPPLMRRTQRRSAPRRATLLIRAGGAGRLAGGQRRGAAVLRAGARAHRRPAASRPRSTSGPGAMARVAARGGGGAGAFRAGDRAASRARARRTRPRASPARLAEVVWDRGPNRGRSREHESVVRADGAGGA